MFNYIWIKNYANANSSNTTPNDVLFDHIVVAKSYIGPIYIPSTGIESVLIADRQASYPNPANEWVKFNRMISEIKLYYEPS